MKTLNGHMVSVRKLVKQPQDTVHFHLLSDSKFPDYTITRKIPHFRLSAIAKAKVSGANNRAYCWSTMVARRSSVDVAEDIGVVDRQRKTIRSPSGREMGVLMKSGHVSDFDIRLLRVFRAVVEEGGFVKAQARLNLAPSTLSEHIKDLEFRLGFTVCLRGRRGFKLTEQGEKLYAATKEMFDHLELFQNKVASLGERSAGVIELGLVDSVITETTVPVSQVIHEFYKLKPDVQVHITIAPPPDLEVALRDGLIDVAIGPFPGDQKTLHRETLYTERQSLFCGTSHPLFRRPAKDIDQEVLRQYDFVACDYPSQADLGQIEPKTTVRTIEALAILILSGEYIGYLPRHAARRWIQESVLWELNEEVFAFDAEFSILTRKVNVEDPTQRAFIRLVKQMSGQFDNLV